MLEKLSINVFLTYTPVTPFMMLARCVVKAKEDLSNIVSYWKTKEFDGMLQKLLGVIEEPRFPAPSYL